MEESVLVGMLLGLGIFLLVIAAVALVIWVITVIGNYKFYEKAGQPGWKAIIPFYNTYTLVEISGLDWYWFLALISTYIVAIVGAIVPFVEFFSWIFNFVVIFARICLYSNLSKKLHKDTGWLICGVIFGNIMTCIAGFSNDTVFDNTVEVSKNGLLDEMMNKNNNNNNNSKNKEN